jgi:hypothetical protein
LIILIRRKRFLGSKICDESIPMQLLHFWTVSFILFLFKAQTQCFGDWSLSSSGGIYPAWPNR